MERSLALDDLGSLTENIYGSALLTAIVATGALRYAAALKKEEQQETANLHFNHFLRTQGWLRRCPSSGHNCGGYRHDAQSHDLLSH